MKKLNVKKTLFKSFTFISLLLIFSSLITFILISLNISKAAHYVDYKKSKVIANEALNYIEDNYESINVLDNQIKLKNILKKTNIEVTFLDLNGKVMYSSQNYPQTENINIKYIDSESLYNINYTSAVISQNKVVGNCIFFIPKTEVITNNKSIIFLSFLPLISGIIITILIIIKAYCFIIKYIFKPVEALNTLSDNISRGNYNSKLIFDIDSEISALSSSFELMQEELKFSMERQLNLERNRKELIACISHDLRTPLSSIKAYVGAIMDGFAHTPEELNCYIKVIDNKTDSISNLIEDFFQHSKAELSELKINRRICYSKEYFIKIIEAAQLDLINSNIKFLVDYNIPDVLINIDPLRIEQVVFNLLQNAKKYTPAGGNISFSAYLEDNFLKLYVRDTGIGISTMDLPYIFDKFYRGRNSYTDGTGLGLAICKYIVEAHGGHLLLESKINEGSTFYFTIPKI